jgi:membrane-associated phospholipid phosphatase
MKYFHFKLLLLLQLWYIPASAQNIDIDLLRSINQHQTGFKDDFTSVVSNSVTPVTIAAPLSLLIAGTIKHDRNLRIQSAYMAGGSLLTILIVQSSKRIIQRQRPFVSYPDIVKRSDGGGYSFPSGHTSSAFYTATSLSILYPKWYVITPAMVWASAAGYARMYEGVHYPSDVLTGALVGAGSAWVSYKVQRWMEHKSAAKKASIPVL